MDLIKTFRPAHWIKNLLVLAPLFFSGEAFPFRYKELSRELIAFAGFCFASSLMYVINDLKDAEEDRSDPAKSRRPYAAGRISSGGMAAAAAALFAAAAVCSVYIGKTYSAITAIYIAVMLFYTWSLKRRAVLGVAVISGGMILRILAGAAAIGVEVSEWVYPAAFLLAFYVVAGKRFFDEPAVTAGKPSKFESAVFSFSGAAAFVVYAVYCFSGAGPEKYHTRHLWVTAPFVGIAIWRYAAVARGFGNGKEHLQAILSDRTIVISVLVWLSVFTALIYL
jgi:4-hydroxybenzoate polyprenyltransferase